MSKFSKLSRQSVGPNNRSPGRCQQSNEGDVLDAAADAAREAQEAVHQEVDARLAAMSPSVRILFDRVRATIPQELIRRVEVRKPAFIVARVASAGWDAPVFEAVTMALEDAVRTEFVIYGVQYQHVPRDEIARRSWQRKNLRDRSEQVLSMLSSGVTIVALAPGEELDPAVVAIADMTLDLTRIELADVETAIMHAFPDSACKWPADVAISEIEPRWIDIAIGRSTSADDALRMIATLNRRPKAISTGPKLEELHGYGSAQAWGLRLVAALREYRAGTRAWSDADAGALLVGPPGTGKTLFASALAESCGVSFVPTSYSAWQSEGEGHLGSVTRAIRKTFSDAAAAAPCIVFIDEIDSLPARRSGTRHDDWWQTIVNNLLECLDGTGRRQGVIVLAACNDDRTLDPALVRSGRLDRRFHIDLPNEDDLLKILAHHLPTIPETDIQPAAEFLKAQGASPVAVDSSEVYTALQRGTLDGAVSGLSSIVSRKWYEVGKNITAIHYVPLVYPVQVNLNWWKGLTDQQRDIIKKAVAKTEQPNVAAIEKEFKDDIALAKKSGDEVYVPTKDDLAKWKAATQQKALQSYYAQADDTGKSLVSDVQSSMGDKASQ
ncbi:TRAP transporter substrate-binding protein DctP [Jiella sp. M17.18]|uniref:TRAP transporter substrate-binding protein DctP n=1 Tax=Jiella sp. M17.18 TaxID=3234247 RepID=UPI0034DE429A